MEELIEKAKNNDKRAFSELIVAIEKELYLIAKTKLKNDDDIGDAIQETIYKSYKNLRKLRDNSLFKTWIIKILINECNNIYKKKRKYAISYEDKENGGEVADTADTVLSGQHIADASVELPICADLQSVCD